MTVLELLAAILKQYPGADAAAVDSFKPVFFARLERHEGDRLASAAMEVFGTFKPRNMQPFPIPAEFEEHLPNLARDLGTESGIRAQLEARAKRKVALFADWHAGQGAKIKEARPFAVYSACLFLAKERAANSHPRDARIILSAEDIHASEQRAVSAARCRAFGPIPKSDETWRVQIAETRAAL